MPSIARNFSSSDVIRSVDFLNVATSDVGGTRSV